MLIIYSIYIIMDILQSTLPLLQFSFSEGLLIIKQSGTNTILAVIVTVIQNLVNDLYIPHKKLFTISPFSELSQTVST